MLTTVDLAAVANWLKPGHLAYYGGMVATMVEKIGLTEIAEPQSS